jgi:hypothetical protein
MEQDERDRDDEEQRLIERPRDRCEGERREPSERPRDALSVAANLTARTVCVRNERTGSYAAVTHPGQSGVASVGYGWKLSSLPLGDPRKRNLEDRNAKHCPLPWQSRQC